MLRNGAGRKFGPIMFEALLAGLFAVFQWPAIGFLILGVLLGIWLGAVPGLGGIIGLVLLLPFTFGMDTVPALPCCLACLPLPRPVTQLLR